MAGAFAFLLFGYEMVRGPSNALYMKAYGPQNLGLILTVTPPLLAALLFGYNLCLSRLGARKTLAAAGLFSTAALALLRVPAAGNGAWAPAALYFIRQAYVVVLIEQYWSFLDSRLSPETARRANGVMTGIGSLGGVLGGYLLGRFSGRLTISDWILGSALCTLAAGAFADAAYHVGGEPRAETPAAGSGSRALGLGSFLREPLLLRLLLLVGISQAFAVIVDLRFQTAVFTAIPGMDAQAAYYGRYYSLLNAGTFFLQFAVTPLALSRLAPGRIQAAIPAVHVGLGVWALLHPSLSSCAAAYLAFKSVDYSLFRSSKEIFYMGLSFDARYRAKELIDILVYRFGKGSTAFLIAVLQRAGIMTIAIFSWSALAGGLAWMGLALPLAWPSRRDRRPQPSS